MYGSYPVRKKWFFKMQQHEIVGFKRKRRKYNKNGNDLRN